MKICGDGGQQARCCLLVIVWKFYSILVDAVFKPDATLSSLSRVLLALLPSKFADADSRIGRHRVMELFEERQRKKSAGFCDMYSYRSIENVTAYLEKEAAGVRNAIPTISANVPQ